MIGMVVISDALAWPGVLSGLECGCQLGMLVRRSPTQSLSNRHARYGTNGSRQLNTAQTVSNPRCKDPLACARRSDLNRRPAPSDWDSSRHPRAVCSGPNPEES